MKLAALRRRIANTGRDLIPAVAGNAVTLGAGLVAGVLAARLLGPSGRGELAAAYAWVGLMLALADMGLPQALPYYAARDPLGRGKQLGSALMMAFVVGTVASLAGYFILIEILKRYGVAVQAMRVYIWVIPVGFITTVLCAHLQGIGRFVGYSVLRSLQALGAVAAFTILWVTGHKEAWHVAGSNSLIQVAVLVSAIILVKSAQDWTTWAFDRTTSTELLLYGRKSYVGNLAWMANGKLDQMMISILLPTEDLGIYAVAGSYAMVLFAISGAIALVTLPRVAKAGDRPAAIQLGTRMLLLNTAITGPTGLLMVLVAPFLIPFVFGERFREAVFPASILVGAGFFLGSNYVLSNILRGLGDPLKPSKAEGIGLIIMILTVVPLATSYGIRGASFAPVVASAVVFLNLARSLWRERLSCP